MKTRNLLIVIIIILVLLNITTLSFLWIKSPDRELARERGKPQEFLKRELGLDKRQRILCDALLLNHRNKMKDLQQRDQDLHRRFFDLLTSGRTDTVRYGQMVDSIARLRVMMERNVFRYFKSIRGILDQSQQEKFDDIFGEIIRMVLPEPPPPPPPPPAGGPPPPPPPPSR